MHGESKMQEKAVAEAAAEVMEAGRPEARPEAALEEETGPAAAEKLEKAIEKELDAVLEAAREDAAETLADLKLTKEQRKALEETAEGLKTIAATPELGGEVDYRQVIANLLEERYQMTIAEFLGAFKPTKLEYVAGPIAAMGTEAAIWTATKVLEVEPADLTLAQKAEFRWKVSGDAIKVLGLIARFFPEAMWLSRPLAGIGEVVSRMGRAMEKVNANPDATVYESAKELTLAALPRNEKGEIDVEATYQLMREVGGAVEIQEINDPSYAEYLKKIGHWIKENPDKVVEGVRRLDQVIETRK